MHTTDYSRPTKFLNVPNHGDVLQLAKQLITFEKIREYHMSSGFLCLYKRVISVLNFALKILAVDEKNQKTSN